MNWKLFTELVWNEDRERWEYGQRTVINMDHVLRVKKHPDKPSAAYLYFNPNDLETAGLLVEWPAPLADQEWPVCEPRIMRATCIR